MQSKTPTQLETTKIAGILQRAEVSIVGRTAAGTTCVTEKIQTEGKQNPRGWNIPQQWRGYSEACIKPEFSKKAAPVIWQPCRPMDLDDAALSRHLSVLLTTVRMPLAEIADEALNLGGAQVRNQKESISPLMMKLLPCELIVRNFSRAGSSKADSSVNHGTKPSGRRLGISCVTKTTGAVKEKYLKQVN